MQIILRAIKNFYFFYNTTAHAILAATPKIAVTPPYADTTPVLYTGFSPGTL